MLQTKIKPLRLEIRNGKFANNEFLIDPPVVLAPMAGITNSAFRTLCREHGAGLYVCEMVTARALIERREETLRLMNLDRKSTRLNSSHIPLSRMPSSA